MAIAFRADLADAHAVQLLALIALLGWIAYEWGPGNEMVTPWLSSRLLADEDGAASIVAVPTIVFIFMLAQQSASGYTALYGFAAFRRSRTMAWTHVKSGEDLNRRVGTPMQLALMSFMLGTTVVALHHTIVSAPEEGPPKAAADVGRTALSPRYSGATAVAIAAVGCAAIVAIVTLIVSILAFTSRSFDSTRETTQVILSLLSNPLLWLTLTMGYLIYLVVPFMRRRPVARNDEAS